MESKTLEAQQVHHSVKTDVSNGHLAAALSSLETWFKNAKSPYSNEVIVMQHELAGLGRDPIDFEDKQVTKIRLAERVLEILERGVPVGTFYETEQEWITFSASDPSIPFFAGPSPLKGLGIDIAQALIEEAFRQSHLLFISCPDLQILKHATYTLAGVEWLKACKAKYVNYPMAARKNAESGFDLEKLLRTVGKGQLYIVDLGKEVVSQEFFAPLESATFTEQYLELLQASDSYVVVTFQSTELLELAKKNTLGAKVWEVDYLELFLALTFDREQAAVYSAQIKRQIDEGVWVGVSDTLSYEFYQEIQDLRKDRRQKFLMSLQARQKYLEKERNKGTDLDEFLQSELRTQSVGDFANAENPLTPYMWYVALYLPGISLTEFGWLVNWLLEVGHDLRQGSGGGATQGGQGEGLPSLRQLWQALPDHWLQKSGLQIVEGEMATVEFVGSYLHRAAKKYLELDHAFFSRRCLYRLIAAALWKKSDVSNSLKAGLIQHIGSQASHDPGILGHRLLVKMLAHESGSLVSYDSHFPESEPEIQLLRNASEQRYGKGHVTLFMTGMLREMLKYPSLESEVGKFLNLLLDRKQGDWVMEVIRKLAKYGPFKLLKWIKRIIDSQDQALQREAALLLESQVLASGNQLYEVLREVANWLPEPSRDEERYSQSNKYSLDFFWWYLGAIRNKTETTLGEWPSRFPLFTPLTASEESIPDWVETLSRFLCHPKVPLQIEYQPGKRHARELVLAAVVEEWGLIMVEDLTVQPEGRGKEAFTQLVDRLSALDQGGMIRKGVTDRCRHLLEEKMSLTVQIPHLNKIGVKRRWPILQIISQHLNQSKI